MSIWEYILLFVSVIAGGGIAFYFQKSNKNMLQMVLSFSGAYILGVAVLHLMPFVFEGHNHSVGYWILGGFFIQLLLDQLSAGVEHGHIHVPHSRTSSFAIQIMLGLCIHAFLEGMPLGGLESFVESAVDHEHNHEFLLWGIIFHKVPAAFALVLLFLQAEFKRNTVAILLFIFAIMSPLGAYMATLMDLSADLQKGIMALVIGSFLHIATTILFEIDGSDHHKVPFRRILAIMAGTGAALLTMV